jgi:Tfp pilus assembly protein PilF
MRSRLAAAVLSAAAIAATVSCSHRAPDADAVPVTFNRDIAPLLQEHCVPCHRPGQMAPFSLIDYGDAKGRAAEIAAVTARRHMPPWLPEPGYGTFANARVLSSAEVDRLARWAAEGAVKGPDADRRSPPQSNDAGWQLGTPDVVVELPEPYVLRPGASDEFRNFVLPIPVAATRFVRGIEVHPGNRHVVHHATLGVDRSRSSRLLDAEDPAPGYSGMFSNGAHSPDSHALGWTPGMTPRLDPPEMAWRLDAGSDLVIQLHLMPEHLREPEPVRPAVAFYLSSTPPTAEAVDFKLGSKTIDIPAGESRYVVKDEYRLPVDVAVLSVYPHAHYLGREMKVFAARPDGRTEWLLWIKHWDFNWQDQYRYAQPVHLPRGSVITMEYTYDNSPDNPVNPHTPPERVVYGPQSSDEMGDVWLRLLPGTREDAATLGRSFIDNELRKDIEVAERGLAEHPSDGKWVGLLGARYVAAGRAREGLEHLRRAAQLTPSDPEIRSNLGLALRAGGNLTEAIVQFSRASQLAPENEQIHVNLANALQDRGDLAGAIRHLRAALRLNPSAAESHNNLGVALASSGDIAGAAAEFQTALVIMPDYADARANLDLARRVDARH